MLLRFLCCLKTFLNYVTDVYKYLNPVGISDSQPYFAFQHSIHKGAVQVSGFSHSPLYL
jgi:hypothetical protein